MKNGLCVHNMVYLVQFVCLSDGVNLKVVATSIAEIERPVYHDVRNSMPHPTLQVTTFVQKYFIKSMTIIIIDPSLAHSEGGIK